MPRLKPWTLCAIFSKVLGKRREEILIGSNSELNQEKVSKFNHLISRRILKEPIAYIIKEKEFWSKQFQVNKNTLIPRPETELLVDRLVKIYKGKKITILDVGTGSGCILISLLGEPSAIILVLDKIIDLSTIDKSSLA